MGLKRPIQLRYSTLGPYRRSPENEIINPNAVGNTEHMNIVWFLFSWHSHHNLNSGLAQTWLSWRLPSLCCKRTKSLSVRLRRGGRLRTSVLFQFQTVSVILAHSIREERGRVTQPTTEHFESGKIQYDCWVDHLCIIRISHLTRAYPVGMGDAKTNNLGALKVVSCSLWPVFSVI